MGFKIKQLTDLSLKDSPILSNVRKITLQDCVPLVSLLTDYADLDENSPSYQKAAVSVVAAILLQERIYFCLSRQVIVELMANDVNYPEKISRSFTPKHYNLILAKLTNDYNLFELVRRGQNAGRKIAVYKLKHPDILKYLQDKVNESEQLKQCIEFSDKKQKKSK